MSHRYSPTGRSAPYEAEYVGVEARATLLDLDDDALELDLQRCLRGGDRSVERGLHAPCVPPQRQTAIGSEAVGLRAAPAGCRPVRSLAV